MPLQSMTGYGMANEQVTGGFLRIEIKSVNHKSLDIRMSAPRALGQWEAKLQGAIKQRIGRGRLSVQCDYVQSAGEADSAAALGIDEAKFGKVVKQLQGLKERHGLSGVIGFRELEPYRSLYQLDGSQASSAEELTWEEIGKVLSLALDRFEQTRRDEGAGIEQMFRGHLAELAQRREALIELRPRLLEGYHERLTERLNTLSESHGLELDQERVISEVNYFTERTDIAEELQRSGAHIERLLGLLDVSGEALGKKLDFYLQEMIRETNTMASKSNFAELTGHVVEMKARVEQLREQAANVE